MASGNALDGFEPLDAETAELNYAELRKRERPFVMRLDGGDPELVERAAYDASYKGVTDLLTLYLWRRPAFYLTRWAAQAGISPNACRRNAVMRSRGADGNSFEPECSPSKYSQMTAES